LPTYLFIFDLEFLRHPLNAPNTRQTCHRTIVIIIVDFVDAFFIVVAAVYLSPVQATL
jgi:hypothetical protein